MNLLFVFAFWLIWPASGLAFQEPDDATRALRSIGRQTWYDRQSDQYVPPEVERPIDNPLRTQGRIADKKNQKKIQQANKSQGSWWRGNWNFGLSGIDPNVFSSVIIAALAVALVVIVGLLAYHSLRQYLPGRWQATNKSKPITIDPAKISDLPFEVHQRAHQNPLAEAEALMRSGNYSLAIVLLYGYMLLALDQSRAIELQRGKTNRMYLGELQRARLREIMEATMLCFEEVYFGKRALSRERFLANWTCLDEFHRLLTTSQSISSVPSKAEVATT
jgi:hypothetical protein